MPSSCTISNGDTIEIKEHGNIVNDSILDNYNTIINCGAINNKNFNKIN